MMSMRETYNNGDEISLKHNGCDGCSPCTIQGVFCHETGCPDAWRDEDDVDEDWTQDDEDELLVESHR